MACQETSCGHPCDERCQHPKTPDDNRLEGEVIEELKGGWTDQMKDLAELMDRHARHWKGYATGTAREEIILADFVAFIARAVADAKRQGAEAVYEAVLHTECCDWSAHEDPGTPCRHHSIIHAAAIKACYEVTDL